MPGATGAGAQQFEDHARHVQLRWLLWVERQVRPRRCPFSMPLAPSGPAVRTLQSPNH